MAETGETEHEVLKDKLDEQVRRRSRLARGRPVRRWTPRAQIAKYEVIQRIVSAQDDYIKDLEVRCACSAGHGAHRGGLRPGSQEKNAQLAALVQQKGPAVRAGATLQSRIANAAAMLSFRVHRRWRGSPSGCGGLRDGDTAPAQRRTPAARRRSPQAASADADKKLEASQKLVAKLKQAVEHWRKVGSRVAANAAPPTLTPPPPPQIAEQSAAKAKSHEAELEQLRAKHASVAAQCSECATLPLAFGSLLTHTHSHTGVQAQGHAR